MGLSAGIQGNPERQVTFRKGDLNEAACAADASRATVWQGNCHAECQLFYNNITPTRNTIRFNTQ